MPHQPLPAVIWIAVVACVSWSTLESVWFDEQRFRKYTIYHRIEHGSHCHVSVVCLLEQQRPPMTHGSEHAALHHVSSLTSKGA